MSYPILLAVIEQKKISISDIANVIQKSTKTTAKKLNGESCLKLSEAKLIYQSLFPETNFNFLFIWKDQ
jgi:hypothetical protein